MTLSRPRQTHEPLDYATYNRWTTLPTYGYVLTKFGQEFLSGNAFSELGHRDPLLTTNASAQYLDHFTCFKRGHSHMKVTYTSATKKLRGRGLSVTNCIKKGGLSVTKRTKIGGLSVKCIKK